MSEPPWPGVSFDNWIEVYFTSHTVHGNENYPFYCEQDLWHLIHRFCADEAFIDGIDPDSIMKWLMEPGMGRYNRLMQCNTFQPLRRNLLRPILIRTAGLWPSYAKLHEALTWDLCQHGQEQQVPCNRTVCKDQKPMARAGRIFQRKFCGVHQDMRDRIKRVLKEFMCSKGVVSVIILYV
jgi:hypothetical protein